MSRQARVIRAVAAGIAGGFAAERWYARSRVAAAGGVVLTPAHRSTTDTVTTRHGTVAMDIYGATNAPTVVLVHGWLCDGRVWQAQVNALAASYRVVTLDLPGHGRSTPPVDGAYTMDVLGDAVAAVLLHIAPAERLVVAGHSLGGMALLNAARRHADARQRIASVVLVATAARAHGRGIRLRYGLDGLARLRRPVEQFVPRLRAALADKSLRIPTNDLARFFTRTVGLGPQASPKVVASINQILHDADADVAFGLAAAVAALDEEAGLSALDEANVPITVLAGRHDRLTPPGRAEAMLAHGADEFVELAHAGHHLPMEAADVVNTTIARHLDALGPDGSTLPRTSHPASATWKHWLPRTWRPRRKGR